MVDITYYMLGSDLKHFYRDNILCALTTLSDNYYYNLQMSKLRQGKVKSFPKDTKRSRARIHIWTKGFWIPYAQPPKQTVSH